MGATLPTGKPDVPLIAATRWKFDAAAIIVIRMRTNIRRMTRLTNGHSKKLANHVHATSLWFMYYNFWRPHMTLTNENGGIKQTPAMAAGASVGSRSYGELGSPAHGRSNCAL